ncbi:MAG TPA: P-loop NTPase, partial [Tepidisphaeraceae bacterium]
MDKETVLAALRTVKDPELNKDLVTLNLIKDIDVDGAFVAVTLTVASPASRAEIEKRATTALREAGFQQIKLSIAGGPAEVEAKPKNLPQVKNVIAVGAGKGGVGKSTVATNLAVGLQRLGAKVGLMDGDIYGPSMPTMLGVKGVTPRVVGNKILPHEVHGLYAVTIGSLVEQDKPLIWRGPMAHGAFKQLLLDNTQWPELDYLIMDLPPGTGDVPI